MRVSTLSMQQGGVANMLRSQAELARTQAQIATGKRVVTAADDPGAFVQVQQVERALAANKQYATNAAVLAGRLSLEEQALADAGNAIGRVQELTLQANNGVLDAGSRRAIAVEIRARAEELLAIANRQDASGDHIFGGTRAAARPFGRVGADVAYAGDTGTRMVQVSSNQRIEDGHSGDEVFMNVPGGTGSFRASAASTNTGTGILDPGSMVNQAAWVPGTYTVQFDSPTSYQVLDATNAVVTSGPFTSGGSISVLGAQIAITGAPATGDRFTLAPGGFRDVFETLDSLVSALESTPGTPAARALLASDMNGIIQQLAQSSDHLLNVRADVGSRLSRLDSVSSTREDLDLELNSSRSMLRDVDYSTAITQMNAQMVSLQAAQQSYTRIAGLSLFDYL
jgi:flagellar hook-associated protein 3 FlgL